MVERINLGELQRKVQAAGLPTREYLYFHGQPPPTPYIRGQSHFISGKPKTGKTERLVELVTEWSAEGEKILYLTEESKSLWNMRLWKLPPALTLKNVNLGFVFGMPQADIVQLVEESDDDIIIVDSISQLGWDMSNYTEAAIVKAIDAIIATCRQTLKTSIFVDGLDMDTFDNKFDIVLEGRQHVGG